MWLVAAGALGALQVARANGENLRRLHAPAAATSSYRDMFFGGIHEAWAAWTAGASMLKPFHLPGPGTFIRWHVLADSLFVLGGVAALALFALAKPTDRRWRRLAFFFVGGAVDLAGNLAELVLSWHRWSWLSWVAGIAWWIAVGCYVLGLLKLAIQGRGLLGVRLREIAAAPAVLRLLLVGVLAMVSLLFAGKIGVQSEDLLERWLDGERWTNGLMTLVGLAGFTVLVASSRLLISKNVGHASAWPLVLLGAVLLVLGFVLHKVAHGGAGTAVLGGIILVTGLLSTLEPSTPVESTASPRWRPREPQLEVDQAWLRGLLASAPVLVIALMMLRSSTNRLSLVGPDQSPTLLMLMGLLGLLMAYAAGLVASDRPLTTAEVTAKMDDLIERSNVRTARTPKVLTRFDNQLADWRPALVYVAIAIVLGLLLALAAGNAGWARFLGVFGLIMFTLCFLAAVGCAVRAALSANTTPYAYSLLGFARTPLATLLLVWIVIASYLNGRTNDNAESSITYYDTHLVARDEPAEAGAPTTDCVNDQPIAAGTSMASVRTAFCTWLATAPVGADQRIPLVMVTAEGGGVRAAGWTAAVLDCMLFRSSPSAGCEQEVTDDAGAPGDEASDAAASTPADRFPALFAANGASGGSVGIASAVAERLVTDPAEAVPAGWIDDKIGGDPLSPTIATATAKDGLLGLFGVYIGADRTRELETEWGESWREAAVYCGEEAAVAAEIGFMTLRDTCGRPIPLLLFNGTNVADGRRVNIAPIDINAEFEPDPERVTLTYDVAEYLCGKDVELFTAAFLSARFPVISASGRLPDQCSPAKAALNIVDGGYGENTGTAQMAELWEQLAPIVEEYNAVDGHTNEVVPVLLEVKTGEAGTAGSGEVESSTWGELFRPIQAIANARSGRDADAAELLISSFTRLGGVDGEPALHLVLQMYEHPGRTLPLGWALSEGSIDDLFTQLGVAPNEQALCTFEQLFAEVSC